MDKLPKPQQRKVFLSFSLVVLAFLFSINQVCFSFSIPSPLPTIASHLAYDASQAVFSSLNSTHLSYDADVNCPRYSTLCLSASLFHENVPFLDFLSGQGGNKGVQTTSKTLWKGQKGRLDVENPNPGQRPGQVHFQDDAGNKYIYDTVTQTFKNAPNWVNKLLSDPSFKNAVEKGVKKYLGLE